MSKKPKKTKAAALRDAAYAGKSNKHITKISATPRSKEQPSEKPADKSEVTQIVHAKSENSPKKSVTDPKNSANSAKANAKLVKSSEKSPKSVKSSKSSDNPNEKPLKEVFVLARPFVALGRYTRDSWRELRQVRWPNRKATWKMTLAVLVYCAIFMVFILLLDTLFTFLFSLLIK